MEYMKTTVDIPDDALEEAMRHAGATTKREAIVRAITEFNRRHRAAALVKQLGTFTSLAANDEIEAGQLQRQTRRRGSD
jgi:Arc/MetJ family transcription regulator